MSRNLDLLPSNALPSERALSLAARFGDDILPEDIKKLWRPQEAPAAFLPFLAWGLHVDFWRDEMPSQAKRNLIAGAFEWHRLEGTFGAIRRICTAVFGETRVLPWYEYGGEPYGFRVTTEGRMGTIEDWEALRKAIWFAQALRDWLDGIEIHRNLRLELYHGTATFRGGVQEIGLERPEAGEMHLTAGVATGRGGHVVVGLSRPETVELSLFYGVGVLQMKLVTIGLEWDSLEEQIRKALEEIMQELRLHGERLANREEALIWRNSED